MLLTRLGGQFDHNGLHRIKLNGTTPRTVAQKKIDKRLLTLGRILYQERYWRPETRGDCSTIPRPCVYIGCRHNLYLDVSVSGSLIYRFPHLEPWEMPCGGSCALDVAERGDLTLEEVGQHMNVTRERARQLEISAKAHVLELAEDCGLEVPSEPASTDDSTVLKWLGES